MDHDVAGPVEDSEHGAANIPRLCGSPGETVPEEVCTDFLDLFDNVWKRKYAATRSNFEKVLQKRARGLCTSFRTRCQALCPNLGAGYSTSSEEKVTGDGTGDGNPSPTTNYRPPGASRWPVSPAVRPAIPFCRWTHTLTLHRLRRCSLTGAAPSNGKAARRQWRGPTATRRVVTR